MQHILEEFRTEFFSKEETEENCEEESKSDLPVDLVLKSSSQEFKPAGLYTQIEDEIKMAHLRKKYRK